MITLPEKYRKEPTGFPFSPVLTVEGKQIVVTSGVVCEDYDNTIPETMEEQARKTILACEKFLRDAGCELTDVFNVEVFLADMEQWDDFNRVYREMMPEPKPCRRALQVGLMPGFLVEIVMWAVQ
ncbi:MAG: RidA family protein [Anaerovoracaceae bacterium]